VHDVLRSGGAPLDAGARSFFEPRFGHDFSKVRVHTGERAAESARAVNAQAFTVGSDIVFAPGHYAPGSSACRELLAHELVHVMQQGSASAPQNLKIGPPQGAEESEADTIGHDLASSGMPRRPAGTAPSQIQRSPEPSLQRKFVVNPTDAVPAAAAGGTPTKLTTAVQGLIADTCPDGHFQVNATSGEVTPQTPQFCQVPVPIPFIGPDISSTPVGCQCICDIINDTQTTTIEFHAGAPGTSPGAPPAGAKPGTIPGTGGTPTSPTVSVDPRFQGQYKISGKWVDIPFHLIFSHELCGHARSLMKGTQVAPAAGPAGGTPPHERVAVDVERQIAAEHNPPLPRRPEDYSGAARQKP
jgi:hypothetical protein